MKTALSMGGLVLLHPLREAATGVTWPSSTRHLKQGQRKRGGSGGGDSFSLNYGEL